MHFLHIFSPPARGQPKGNVKLTVGNFFYFPLHCLPWLKSYGSDKYSISNICFVVNNFRFPEKPWQSFYSVEIYIEALYQFHLFHRLSRMKNFRLPLELTHPKALTSSPFTTSPIRGQAGWSVKICLCLSFDGLFLLSCLCLRQSTSGNRLYIFAVATISQNLARLTCDRLWSLAFVHVILPPLLNSGSILK